MATAITCPQCGHQFPMEEAVSEEYKKDLREQMLIYKKNKDEEIARKQAEFSKKEIEFKQQAEQWELAFSQKLTEEKNRIQLSLEESIRKRIANDFENRLLLLQQSNKDNEDKLKDARLKEYDFLRKEQDFKIKEAELEVTVQRTLQEERSKLSDEIRRVEEQKIASREIEFQMKVKELEKQLEDQKRLAQEMQRKAEQGSMQLQGEIQELALEELLRLNFPFDEITEVGKGVRGADSLQSVRNNFGQICGKIIFESKRTENFSLDWLDKLKADMRIQGADVAVLVTRTMPKDMNQFGEKNGVWICSFSEVKPVVHMLREGIIKVFIASKSQENKGDKMHLLYNYLTSNEFGEQWKAIREGFLSMRSSIQRERDAMEKLWKAREKQLEKVLLNTAHIKGSVDGIAGHDSIDFDLPDNGEEGLLTG